MRRIKTYFFITTVLASILTLTASQCLPKRPYKTADNPYSIIDRTGISTTSGSEPIKVPTPQDPLCYSTGFWFQISSDSEPANTEYLLMQYTNPVLVKVYLTKTSATDYKLMA
jgi:hypothetical protein